MRVALLLALAVSACSKPSIESGRYVVRSAGEAFDGAQVSVDADKREIWALGGCSGSGLFYELNGSEFRTVGGAATASGPCPDGAAEVRNIALSSAIYEKPGLAVTADQSGFTIARPNAAPIRFDRHADKNR